MPDEEAAPKAEKAAKVAAVSASAFSDQTIACLDCGVDFVFSAGEQAFFAEKGYVSGKSRCTECTAAKKARFGEASGPGTAARERAARTTCYTCGQTGHSSKQCKDAPCYNCNQKGHKSKDCPAPRDNKAGGGVCFKFQAGNCTRGDSCRFAHIATTDS